ncbi:sensor histidine kinase [Streptomyces hainanensis]|uniref:histidine kinase n=1 Tax=Streptomyces hainanensis TaxID=402648 RepID=A0A4R4TCW2_9ACTN|nr:HAMP domain-containing sensor histidine kinase [Streptomyces hainanensis]TDC75140.1 HAMP domain-containing histidine kinase [Streptomyces hainanensis]
MRLSRLRRPPFRARLAAAFTGLFLLAGVVLLAFVVLLARYGTAQRVEGMAVRAVDDPDPEAGGYTRAYPTTPLDPDAAPPVPPLASPSPSASYDAIDVRLVNETVRAVQDTVLHQLLLWSGMGLVLLALLAGAMGWWLAGRALRPVAAVTDAARRISEERLHERLALTGPDDELHRLAATFDGMLDRLERSFDSQRRFVANAAHELRTPLAAQRTSLEVGLADPLPDDLAEVREELLTTNREAERLIAALLVLARSDLGLDTVEECDLRDVARRVADELRPLAAERRVSVTLTAADPVPIHGEPVLLRHLVANLVGNAVRYNLPDGTVSIRLTGRTLTVVNTGAPVDPDEVDGLFEPFRRLGQDRTSATGHGLGLSVVASIAAAHDARVTARPGPDGGLTVAVTFPDDPAVGSSACPSTRCGSTPCGVETPTSPSTAARRSWS